MGERTPLQNRVTPVGEIVSHPGRGLLMGNRGCLHGQGRELGVARWRSKLWICCVLRWKDVRRDPMPPGRWTALFFLDEATALAAGHRPCAYCRRQDFLAYAHAWGAAAGLGADGRPRATEMDGVLHAQRVHARTRRQVTRPVAAADLPDGVMVRLDHAKLRPADAGSSAGEGRSAAEGRSVAEGRPAAKGGPAADGSFSADGSATADGWSAEGAGAALVLGGWVLPWSFAGYGTPIRPPATVELLTPPATVAAIAAGYRPWLHPTVSVPHNLRVLGPDPSHPDRPAAPRSAASALDAHPRQPA